MANDVAQVSSYTNASWRGASSHHHQNTLITCVLPEPGVLDETVEIVKEKVWGFRNAWKGFADVFSKIGVSPTVFGYSSVSLHEEDYVKEHSEDVLALAKVDAEGDNPPSRRHKILLTEDIALDEDDSLIEVVDNDEDVNHAFAESSRREFVERKSLTSSVG